MLRLGTSNHECLAKRIVFGERSLRRALAEPLRTTTPREIIMVKATSTLPRRRANGPSNSSLSRSPRRVASERLAAEALVLSQHSIRSPWVEKEVEAAFEREHREKHTVLFPIRLDDAIMETDEAWAADIRRIRHIGDFTRWENHADYSKAFQRLMQRSEGHAGLPGRREAYVIAVHRRPIRYDC